MVKLSKCRSKFDLPYFTLVEFVDIVSMIRIRKKISLIFQLICFTYYKSFFIKFYIRIGSVSWGSFDYKNCPKVPNEYIIHFCLIVNNDLSSITFSLDALLLLFFHFDRSKSYWFFLYPSGYPNVHVKWFLCVSIVVVVPNCQCEDVLNLKCMLECIGGAVWGTKLFLRTSTYENYVPVRMLKIAYVPVCPGCTGT